jgi:hypothetical protein
MNTGRSQSTGIGRAWLLALVFTVFFTLLLATAMSAGKAFGHALLLLLPNFWLARLIIAQHLGRMTRRFNFLNSAEMESTLVITGARVLHRDSERWAYWSNWLREACMCLVLWLLLGPAALAPLAEPLSMSTAWPASFF